MAGIGVKLNKIYGKNTITTNIVGFFYSTIMTIAPVLVVIINLMLMQYVLKFNTVSYINRELFSCTVLYIFIFSLLTTSPFNAVLSRYMSDVIFEERYEDVQPCHRVGLLVNICFSCLFAIPFCIHEHIVGGVPIYYVFTGYCCFVSLVLVFYNMLYLSICKEYKLISLYFFIGMFTSFLLSLFFRFICKMSIPYSMLLALTIGFFLTAVLEWAKVHQFFPDNSEEYTRVFEYFGKYWQLILINFLYTLGLFIHNFVFWGTDMAMHLVKSFVCNQPYDMATCLAMFTNVSASVIFISRVEMYFHERYRDYADAVFGGRGLDIRNTKKRMFRQLASELMTLVRLQFVVSVFIYLGFVIFLPQMGYAGLVMRIYPMMAAAYFVLFLMYSEIIFLYYFEDLNGALLTSVCFCVGTFLSSLVATHLSSIFYGFGAWVGSVIGFTVAYVRLRWMEHHLDEHMFCRGNIIKHAKGIKPSPKVFDLEEQRKEEGSLLVEKEKEEGQKDDEKTAIHN
ncbi:MAG: exopolysaccharide Pel transporter PelG [Clostridia bacterium]